MVEDVQAKINAISHYTSTPDFCPTNVTKLRDDFWGSSCPSNSRFRSFDCVKIEYQVGTGILNSYIIVRTYERTYDSWLDSHVLKYRNALEVVLQNLHDLAIRYRLDGSVTNLTSLISSSSLLHPAR